MLVEAEDDWPCGSMAVLPLEMHRRPAASLTKKLPPPESNVETATTLRPLRPSSAAKYDAEAEGGDAAAGETMLVLLPARPKLLKELLAGGTKVTPPAQHNEL